MATAITFAGRLIQLIDFAHKIAEQMSRATFGFATEDFLAATRVGQEAEGILVQLNDNVIILNFRALQAQRVKEMQRKLLDLSVKKIGLERGEDHEELEGLNNDVDLWLGRYGVSTSSMF